MTEQRRSSAFGAGSDYKEVSERLRDLAAKYPDASMQPVNPHKPYEIVDVGGKTFVVYAAACYRTPDDKRPGIGVAWEPFPGPTQFTRDSELMNAETSAWGRAINAALASESKHIASANEVRNRSGEEPKARQTRQAAPKPYGNLPPNPDGPLVAVVEDNQRLLQLIGEVPQSQRGELRKVLDEKVGKKLSTDPLTEGEARKVEAIIRGFLPESETPGEAPVAPADGPGDETGELATEKQTKAIFARTRATGWDENEVKDWAKLEFGFSERPSMKSLTRKQASAVIDMLGEVQRQQEAGQ